MERAFRRAPLAVCGFVAVCLQWCNKSCCNLCFCSVSSPDLVEHDREADGVVGLPELLPQVGVGQVFPSSPSGEAVDHKHTVSPDDDLLRGSPGQSESFNCCEEFSS